MCAMVLGNAKHLQHAVPSRLQRGLRVAPAPAAVHPRSSDAWVADWSSQPSSSKAHQHRGQPAHHSQDARSSSELIPRQPRSYNAVYAQQPGSSSSSPTADLGNLILDSTGDGLALQSILQEQHQVLLQSGRPSRALDAVNLSSLATRLAKCAQAGTLQPVLWPPTQSLGSALPNEAGSPHADGPHAGGPQRSLTAVTHPTYLQGPHSGHDQQLSTQQPAQQGSSQASLAWTEGQGPGGWLGGAGTETGGYFGPVALHLAELSIALAPRMQPRHLSTLLWALSILHGPIAQGVQPSTEPTPGNQRDTAGAGTQGANTHEAAGLSHQSFDGGAQPRAGYTCVISHAACLLMSHLCDAGTLARCQPRDMVQALHAAARMRMGSLLPDSQRHALLTALEGTLHQCSPQDLSMLVYALGLMHSSIHPQENSGSQQAAGRHSTALPNRPQQRQQYPHLEHQQRQAMTQGFVPTQRWLQALLTACFHKLQHFTPQGLSNMLWGLAVLGCYQPPDDWALAVLRASYHMLKENSMQHQELAITAWALCVLRIRPPQLWLQQLCTAFYTRLHCAVSSVNPNMAPSQHQAASMTQQVSPASFPWAATHLTQQDVALVMDALAVWSYQPPPQVLQCVAHFMSRSAASMSPQQPGSTGVPPGVTTGFPTRAAQQHSAPQDGLLPHQPRGPQQGLGNAAHQHPAAGYHLSAGPQQGSLLQGGGLTSSAQFQGPVNAGHQPQNLRQGSENAGQGQDSVDQKALIAASSGRGSQCTVVSQASRNIRASPVRALCMVLRSMARMRASPPPSLLAQLTSQLPLELPHCSPVDLAAALNALALAKHPVDSKWMIRFLQECRVKLPAFRASDLAVLLLSLARLRVRPEQGWMEWVLMESTVRMAPAAHHQQQPQQGPQPALHHGSQLGAAHHNQTTPAQELQQQQQRVGDPYARQGPQPGHHLSNGLADISTPGGLSRLHETGVLMAPVDPSCGPTELANILWALGTLGYRPSPTWLATFWAASSQLLPSFRAKHVWQVAVALAKLGLVAEGPSGQGAEQTGPSGLPAAGVQGRLSADAQALGSMNQQPVGSGGSAAKAQPQHKLQTRQPLTTRRVNTKVAVSKLQPHRLQPAQHRRRAKRGAKQAQRLQQMQAAHPVLPVMSTFPCIPRGWLTQLSLAARSHALAYTPSQLQSMLAALAMMERGTQTLCRDGRPAALQELHSGLHSKQDLYSSRLLPGAPARRDPQNNSAPGHASLYTSGGKAEGVVQQEGLAEEVYALASLCLLSPKLFSGPLGRNHTVRDLQRQQTVL